MAEAAEFLDGIKNLGYQRAFKGGLSFNLGDISIPEEKEALVQKGYEEVEQVINNYNMGFITRCVSETAVGPALGSKGINIMEFCKQFNARTQDKAGKIPVSYTHLDVYKRQR